MGKPVIKTLTAGGTIISPATQNRQGGVATVTTTQGGKQTIVIAAPRSAAGTASPHRIVTTVPKAGGESVTDNWGVDMVVSYHDPCGISHYF